MEHTKRTYGNNKITGVKKNYSKTNLNAKASAIVFGDMVIVQHAVTKEKVKFKITDKKNPFIGKSIRDVVKLKGEDYSVYMINGRRF